MTNNPTNQYLRTKVMTASPEQLQLMLYDGALRFTRQGRQALADDRRDDSCESLLRAQKIVMEINANLRHDLDPKLCQRLSAIYTYIYRRLVHANMEHDIAAVDEALELLEYQRETWVLLMDQLRSQRNDDVVVPAAEVRDADAEPADSEVVTLDIAG